MKKNNFWQIIRGLCIIAVVMIHCPNGVGTSTQSVWLFLRQFINFPVATFIFLSGYFVNSEKIKDTRTYIQNRGGRLLIPYLLWSAFYSLINLARGKIEFGKVIYNFLTGNASTPFYYILVLIQLTILTPWLVGEVKKKNEILWTVTPVYLVCIYAFNLIIGRMPRFYETFFPAWFLFYYLGLWVKIHGVRIVGKLWMIVAGLAVCIAEAFILLGIGADVGFAASQIRFGSFFYTSMIIFFLLRKADRESEVRVLKYIGDRSYGIFYIHCFILMFARQICIKVGLEKLWLANYFGCFAMAMVGSLVIIEIIRWMAKKLKAEKCLRWVGFD